MRQTNHIGNLARLLAVGAVLLAPAGTASAAPFTLASGADIEDPSVAVDENGVGHFAWNQDVPFVSNENDGPDVLHYCQVPRNGTACALSRTFTLPEDDLEGPKVLLHPDGRVLIVSGRCCGSNPSGGSLDVTWLLQSEDGGNTWSAPKAIGTLAPSGDAIVGPGEFSVSTISSVVTGGTFLQSMPMEGYTEAVANVGDRGNGINNPSNNGTLAFIDPLTPIATMSDGDKVYFRKWSGVGDYNDLGSWGPLTEIGPGSEPEVVGGKRGVYVAYKTKDFPRQYRVARWGGLAFGESKALTPKASPNAADFFQDQGGTLHFVWQENEDSTLKHRFSRDGTTWSEAETLTPEDDFAYYNAETATARDGGGWAVWDANSGGPIQAVQYGPKGTVTDPPDSDVNCPTELDVGGATVVAREGCLKRGNPKSIYTTNGDVRVNGIDLYTPGAQGARAAGAKPAITIDTKARTLISGTKIEAKVGNVVLDKAELSWKLPGAAGQIQDLAGNPAPFDTSKFKIEFLGLGVTGQVTPKILPDGSVELPVNLALPKPLGGLGGLGGITGQITLRADVKNGLKLSALKIHADHVGLGIAEIHPLDIEYIGDPSKLYGKVNLLLPAIKSALETEFQLTGGDFDFGRAKLTFPAQGIPVASGVFLKSVSFSISTKPTKISGGVSVNAFGEIGGVAVLSVDGTVSYTFPDSPNPGIFRVEGTGKLVGIGFGSIFAQYETSGKATFGGRVDIGDTSTLGIHGAADGGVDLNTLAFDLYGTAQACAFSICPLSVTMLISSKAIGACFGGDTIGIGAVYIWETQTLDDIWSCGMSKYKALSAAKVSQTGQTTVNVDGGQPQASLQVFGNGAPPRVTVTGPGGQTIASGTDPSNAVVTPVGVVVQDIATQSTIVNLNRPEGGNWTVAPQPGSVSISSVRTADALPKPSAKARVTGKGYKRTLHWTVKQIPGQTVRLVEEGAGAYTTLANPGKRKGFVRFRPADGKKGKRTIYALIEQDGMPQPRLKAGTYTAPGTQLPSKPRKVRLKRKGTKLVVTWRAAPGADKYAVRVVLKDGRRMVIPTKKRKLTIRDVPGIDKGTILVYGLTDVDAAGKPAKAKLKAKPKKRKKKRRG